MSTIDKIEASHDASLGTVLVIDDHPLYCDALVSVLCKLFDTKDFHTVNTLNDGLEFARSDKAPDLVLLDLKLPDVSGLTGFFQIKKALPDVPVLVISSVSSYETIKALMDAGAAGFVPKDADQSVFKTAIQHVAEGLKYMPEGLLKEPSKAVGGAANPDDFSCRIAKLTPQQNRIMQLICAGKQNKQIAYEMNLAEATVKAHITALLRRLGVSNRTQAAVLVNSTNWPQIAPISDEDARALLS